VFGKKKKDPREEARLLAVKDYEKLGKQVASLYDAINPDRKGLYRTAFLKGIVTGLGGVIGATLVVVILAWVLSLLGHVPFVGPIFDNVRDTVQSGQ
jgi:hypothetical protein